MSTANHTAQIEYREIPESTGYRFGSDGSIWSRWKLRKRTEVLGEAWRRLNPQKPSKRGYYRVWVKLDGKPKLFNVHTLILRAFRGPCPAGQVGRHWDDNKLNNRLENLFYGTQFENVQDQIRNGHMAVGERRNSAKFTEAIVREIRKLHAEGWGVTKLARKHGVNHNAIGCIVRRKTWRHVL